MGIETIEYEYSGDGHLLRIKQYDNLVRHVINFTRTQSERAAESVS